RTVASSTGGTSIYGQPVSFTISVTARAPGSGTPSGLINITLDGTTGPSVNLNASGQYVFTPVSTIPIRTHTITFSYLGDGNFNASNSRTLTQTISQAATSLATVTGTPNPSTYGQTVTFSTTVSATAPGAGTPTGPVTFFDGSTSLGALSVNAGGVAQIIITSALAAGNHSITASYGGDGNFLGSSTSAAQTQTTK